MSRIISKFQLFLQDSCRPFAFAPNSSPLTPNGFKMPHASHFTPHERGFTLIELMMVVTVAGILVTLAEPSFHQSVIKAREAALKQNLFTMRDVIDQFRADKGQYPGDLGDLKAAGYLKRIPLDPFTKSDSTWQVILDQTDPGIFDVHSGSDLVALDGTAYNEW
jgi:general secretion pathway protein G